MSAAFASNYVDTLIGHQLVLELAAKKHLHVTSADLTAAHAQLEAQITAILQDVAGSTYACGTGATALTAANVLPPCRPRSSTGTLQFDATVSVFEEHVAGVGSTHR